MQVGGNGVHQRIIEQLCDRIASSQTDAGRVLVALAGPPGSGKTTFSAQLAQGMAERGGEDVAAVLPMDGFHLENDTLSEMGLLHRKGAPETFDVSGFTQLVKAVRRDNGPVAYPTFDRVLDKVQPNAKTLPAGVRFVIFEGNYLLLQQRDWASLRELFDVTILLRAELAHLRKRLIARWLDHGLNAAQAEKRADSNDMVNAALVLEHSVKPHLTLVTQSNDQITLEATGNMIRDAG